MNRFDIRIVCYAETHFPSPSTYISILKIHKETSQDYRHQLKLLFLSSGRMSILNLQ